ncbi:serine carboxypeptidase-like 1 isoform X2 [Prunus persica]|uniref:serine carboxypeptidase-like 1 isoform X2 n=1 Tax=Prunus persica TaxID=3760 RepID=UPI0009AB631B|nr:serine carboxypeptidase-like 1 isoform X2 [Prunus persica]
MVLRRTGCRGLLLSDLQHLKSIITMLPLALLLVFLNSHIIVASKSTIDTLPGFSGELPFKLETGYVGVGDLDDVQLFYYFIESERSPKEDPLVLWLTGGPGCSGFSGLAYQIGPIMFNYANSSGNEPTLMLNPYSWTKVANIIFLDQPVGSGFSYAKSWQGYETGDISSASHTYEFLRKWLKDHPEFLKNPLYIAGDSYSGITVPIVVQEVSNGNFLLGMKTSSATSPNLFSNEVGHEPPLNLKGYVLGNPFTEPTYDVNSRIKFAHRMALISDTLYESTKTNCKGEYVQVDPSNAPCVENLQEVTECTQKIYYNQILEPKCSTMSPNPKIFKWDQNFDDENFLDMLHHSTKPWCRPYNYLFSFIWANDKTVQNALHVREGTIKGWEKCNQSLSSNYAHDVRTSIDYHRNLTKKNLRALVYSGDHDMLIPYVGTQEWIKSLNLSVDYQWRPWFVNGQVAGYTNAYTRKTYSLTFVTVKGGGHTAPEFKSWMLQLVLLW